MQGFRPLASPFDERPPEEKSGMGDFVPLDSPFGEEKKVDPKPPIELKPEPEPSFFKEVIVKSATDLGKNILGGAEAAANVLSGAAAWPAQKVAGFGAGVSEPITEEDVSQMMTDPNFMGSASLPKYRKFDVEAAKKAEDALQDFVYQPLTKEGRIAVEGAIAPVLDLVTKPSKMARAELEKLGFPLLGYLTEIGGDLASLKLAHTAGKGIVRVATPKSPFEKLPTKAEPLDTTFGEQERASSIVQTREAGGLRPLEKVRRAEDRMAIEREGVEVVGEKAKRLEDVEAAFKGQDAGEFKPLESPVEEGVSARPERIVASATKHPVTGKVFTGKHHGESMENAGIPFDDPSLRSPMGEADKVNGFVTNTGRFVDRVEALEISRKANQAPSVSEAPGLDLIVQEDLDAYVKKGTPQSIAVEKPTIINRASQIAKDINQVLGEKGAIGELGDMTPEQKAAFTRLSGELTALKMNAQKVGKSLEQYLVDLKVDPKTAALLSRRADELPKYAGSVNLQKQNIPEDYKQFETDIAKPKRTQTWDQTGELSSKIQSDLTKSLKAIKKAEGLKGLTESMDAVRQMNVNAIDRLSEIAKAGDLNQFNKSFNTYRDSLFNVVSDASSEIGRALNIHKKEVSVNRLVDSFNELKRGLNEREFEEFKKINWENPNDVKAFMERLGDPKLSDYLIEYWYNQILSGPPTHLVNAISNTGWYVFNQAVHNPLVAMIDLPYSKLTGKERTRYLNEIVPTFAGFKKGFGSGASYAWDVVKTGRSNSFESKFSREIGQATGAFERSPYKSLRMAAPFVTMSTRALRAMDVWAKSIAYDTAMAQIAERTATTQKLTGEAKSDFVRSFVEKPPSQAHAEAMKEADYMVFMDAPDPITQSIIALREKVPWNAGRFVVPFVNTIANLTKRGVEMTPGLGIIKEAASRSRVMGRGSATPQVIAKQIEGSVLALYLLNKFELGEITGGMPQSESEREAWYRQGKKPWAIRFGGTKDPETGEILGGTYLQFRRIEPFNTPIASVAIARDKILNAKDDATASQIFFDTANALKDNLIDSSYFQGIQQVFDRYQSAEKAIPRFAAGWVPYSSFWRSINRSIEVATDGDAKVRERIDNDFGNALKESFSMVIPGLPKTTPTKLNVWGEEVVIPGGVFRQWLPYKWDVATDDPVELTLEKVGIYPALPNRTVTIRGKKVELDEDIYRQYAIDAGNKMKERLMNKVSNPLFQQRLNGSIGNEEKMNQIRNELTERIESTRMAARHRAIREQIKNKR